jgi:hypothetical protein
MYQGPADDDSDGVLAYFERCGYPLPPKYSSTEDWILEVAMSQSMVELTKAGFLLEDRWDLGQAQTFNSLSKEVFRDGSCSTTTEEDDDDNESPHRAGFLLQTKLLIHREMTKVLRDKEDIKARIGTTLTIRLCTSLIFYQIGKTDFSEFINAQSTLGACVTVLVVGNLLSVVLCRAYPPFHRNGQSFFESRYSTGHYTPSAPTFSPAWRSNWS